MIDLAKWRDQSAEALSGLTVDTDNLVRWCCEQTSLVRRDGTWCEFGVAGGGMLDYMSGQRGGATLWGFDSCRGLPEHWNARHPAGMFAMQRPPMPPEGCNLVVGWFKDTLSAWRPPVWKPITFMHLDCDLYSSAETVLRHVWDREDPYVVGGTLSLQATVIVVDDYFTEPLDNGVLRALAEHLTRNADAEIKWLARAGKSDAVALKVVFP